MRSGPLRFRVRLQNFTTTADSFGQQVPTWTSVGTYWANIRFLTGREAVNALQKKAETTHQIVMRYVGQIDATMRIVYPDPRTGVDRVFNILDCNNVNERNAEWLLKAQEVTAPSSGG